MSKIQNNIDDNISRLIMEDIVEHLADNRANAIDFPQEMIKKKLDKLMEFGFSRYEDFLRFFMISANCARLTKEGMPKWCLNIIGLVGMPVAQRLDELDSKVKKDYPVRPDESK